jgi:hypothetical protein
LNDPSLPAKENGREEQGSIAPGHNKPRHFFNIATPGVAAEDGCTTMGFFRGGSFPRGKIFELIFRGFAHTRSKRHSPSLERLFTAFDRAAASFNSRIPLQTSLVRSSLFRKEGRLLLESLQQDLAGSFAWGLRNRSKAPLVNGEATTHDR